MHQTLLLFVFLSQFCPSLSQNHVYHFINNLKVPWSEAQQYCRKYYTDLATVSDLKDLERLKQAAGGETGAWIGLHQTSLDSSDRENWDWHWSQPRVEFSEGSFSWNMASEEPNNGGNNGGKDEYCVVVDTAVKGLDVPCKNPNVDLKCFICYDEKSNSPHLIPENKTWLEAQRFCRQHHTDLISGNEQLNMYKSQQQKQEGECWIGLSRDNWGWSDGSNSSFRNWIKDVNPLGADNKTLCAKLRKDGGWESTNCDQPKYFICHDERFILVKENKTWEEAMAHCRRHYLDLAWHKGPNTRRMVQERAKMADTEVVWVGLHFACFFEEWMWVNGHWVSEDDKNWKKPGPSKCGVSGAMERGGRNEWVKRPSNERHNFICAKNYCG